MSSANQDRSDRDWRIIFFIVFDFINGHLSRPNRRSKLNADLKSVRLIWVCHPSSGFQFHSYPPARFWLCYTKSSEFIFRLWHGVQADGSFFSEERCPDSSFSVLCCCGRHLWFGDKRPPNPGLIPTVKFRLHSNKASRGHWPSFSQRE